MGKQSGYMPLSRVFIKLSFCMLSGLAAAATPKISDILESLTSVHSIGEVAISPDGNQVVYGTVLTGKRAGADVDVSALWIAKSSDGSGGIRLTACPGSVCDEHGAAWSPDGRQIAFVTTDEKDQPQIAVASATGRDVKIITAAHGPLDTPRWSPDGNRIAFLYSAGAPKSPGPLNPLAARCRRTHLHRLRAASWRPSPHGAVRYRSDRPGGSQHLRV